MQATRRNTSRNTSSRYPTLSPPRHREAAKGCLDDSFVCFFFHFFLSVSDVTDCSSMTTDLFLSVVNDTSCDVHSLGPVRRPCFELTNALRCMLETACWFPGAIVIWIAFPVYKVFCASITTIPTLTLVYDALDFPCFFSIRQNVRRWTTRLLAPRKTGTAIAIRL
jgi:hypothetical protein